MNKKNIKPIIALLLITTLFFVMYYFNLGHYLSLENIKQNKEYLLELTKQNWLTTILGYIVLYILVAGFSIPGAAPLTITGGFLFGSLPATLYVCIGATIGATFAFLMSRYLIGSWVQEKYKEKLVTFNHRIKQYGARYLLTLRLIPLFPFFMINIFAGLTNLSLSIFILITGIGIVPGAFVYAYAGRQLQTINSIKDLFATNMLVAVGMLMLLILIPMIIKNIKNKKI